MKEFSLMYKIVFTLTSPSSLLLLDAAAASSAVAVAIPSINCDSSSTLVFESLNHAIGYSMTGWTILLRKNLEL